MPSDEQLMARVKDQDDGGAYKILYEKHKGRCYQLAFKVLRNQEDAADAAQQAFMKLWA